TILRTTTTTHFSSPTALEILPNVQRQSNTSGQQWRRINRSWASASATSCSRSPQEQKHTNLNTATVDKTNRASTKRRSVATSPLKTTALLSTGSRSPRIGKNGSSTQMTA